MKNQVKHINSNLTIITCLNVDKKILEDIYLDTDVFNLIKDYDVEWKIYKNKNNGNPNQQFQVIGKNSSETLDLKRKIGLKLFGEGYRFGLINYDYFDLRKDNIFYYPESGKRGTSVKDIREYSKSKLEPLSVRLNKNNEVSLSELQIVEYNGELLFVKNNKVIKTIEKEYLIKLRGYFKIPNKSYL